MARAEKVFEDREVVTIEQVHVGVTLHLTLDEAQRIKDILGRFNSCGTAGMATGDVYSVLETCDIVGKKYTVSHHCEALGGSVLKLNYA